VHSGETVSPKQQRAIAAARPRCCPKYRKSAKNATWSAPGLKGVSPFETWFTQRPMNMSKIKIQVARKWKGVAGARDPSRAEGKGTSHFEIWDGSLGIRFEQN